MLLAVSKEDKERIIKCPLGPKPSSGAVMFIGKELAQWVQNS
jgi:hypothetical protein